MRVAIIDYGSGNLRSVTKAFEYAARSAGIAAEIGPVDDPEAVRTADRIVLPGVGAFRDCRLGLEAVTGMAEALQEAVIDKGRPFLGICVGMQLMADRGLEKTVTDGLGWIAGEVKQLAPSDPSLKIPHVGWNTIHVKHSHPLLKGIPTGTGGLHAYFVHSYALHTPAKDVVVATTDYGGEFTSVIAFNNLAGTQFHPEKSQALGLAMLENFLKWEP